MRKGTFAAVALGALLLLPGLAGVAPAAEKTRANSIGMEFVLIPAGSFTAPGEHNKGKATPAKMIITKPFYLGKYPVTQEQWEAVMGNNPSFFKGRNNPVENISWNEAQEFIKRLNAREGHARYRLPTEAEWELAARGGTSGAYFFGETEDSLGDYAWFRGNTKVTTYPVGQKKPNPYGLYDIYGNVWEWVHDWYADLPDKELADYSGPASGVYRARRGCSWSDVALLCRSGFRNEGGTPNYRIKIQGVRLALSVE